MAWEKKISQTDAVKAFLVAEGSSINLEASVVKFRETALMHIAKQEAEEVLIKMCLNEVYDHYKGSWMNADALFSATIKRMEAKVPELGNPSLYSFLCKRIDGIIHEDSSFVMKKGMGKGWARAKDQNPAE